LVRDSDPASSPSLRSSMQGSMQGDIDRSVVLSEKLQQSKKKNTELKSQITELQSQLAQMTQRVQQLHAMHAKSSAELVEQTKHACESAAARLAEEAEQKAKHDLTLARQSASDAMEAERSFTTSLVRKVETIQQLFPDQYATQTDSLSASTRTASTLPRNVLHSFFESTRQALHDAHHIREQLAEAKEELRLVRLRTPLDESHRFAVQRHAEKIAERISRVQKDLLIPQVGADGNRGALIQQRDTIIATVDNIEKRMHTARTLKQAEVEAQEQANKVQARSMSAPKRLTPGRKQTNGLHSLRSPTRTATSTHTPSPNKSGGTEEEQLDQLSGVVERTVPLGSNTRAVE
jgi:cell division septum initiation protein DivIVA